VRTMPLLLQPLFREFYSANFHGGKRRDGDAVRSPQHAAHFHDEGAVENAGERRRPLRCTRVRASVKLAPSPSPSPSPSPACTLLPSVC